MNRAQSKPSSSDHRSSRDNIEYCLDNMKYINRWEFDFLIGIAGYERLTDKQSAKLAAIIYKVRTARRYRSKQR
jgi:hypothetical protein